MKTIKLFVYALVVCMSFVSVAEAKGRSGSFKTGFSSQKRAAPKPAPSTYQAPPTNTQAKNTAFGSFGASNPKLDQKVANVPQSQMSKDLSATAAQSNALKTADARTKTNANGMNNATNSESGWFRSGNQNATTQKPNAVAGGATNSQPTRYQPAPQHNSGQQSSGLLPGLIGFMIGNSLAQQHANTAHVQQPNQNAGTDTGAINSTTADGVAIQPTQDVPVVETESFFVKLLRFALWIAMISGVVWLVRKFMNFRSRNLHQAANYSLRS
ncbi:hypothetical protein GCM10011613_34600 [Cellvibrio zantedeschiae]|uniref:Uncharacterized protein n=1 Tax=Cellvibrio zantedeschiae TaxID=1237077 RepID=A0ABQ3BA25_9GAMM|nr:hypothetical protein [Cellvibrio zantedeschiae]GGY86535.1 hypothetical protein GCM10011613_34600 [Cellvibrio zantedeschiae]